MQTQEKLEPNTYTSSTNDKISSVENKLTAFFKRVDTKVSLVLLLGLIFTFIVTNGDMKVLAPDNLGITYVKMWDNLKVGRYDIERWALGIEAYTRNGKTYSYFAPFPALLRGVIELFFKRSSDWSRVSTILAALLTVVSCTVAYYRVLMTIAAPQLLRYYFTALFALTITFGSPVMVLLSSAGIYHEALMWGLAWSCVFICAFIYFLYSDVVNSKLLFILSLSAGFAFLTRITFGASTLIALAVLMSAVILAVLSDIGENEKARAILDWLRWSKLKISKAEVKKILALGIIPALVCTLFMMKVNYERWGSPFTFLETKYYDLFKDTERGRRAEGSGVFNFARMPHAFAFYFVPSKEHFTNQFPYIAISSDNFLSRKFKPAVFDSVDPVTPLPINSPYLFLCALIGLFALTSTYGRLGIGVVLSFVVINFMFLSFYSITQRYVSEFMPLLVLCALGSFLVLVKFIKGKKSLFVTCFIALVITLFGMYGAFATLLQVKMIYWYYGFDDYVRGRTASFIQYIERKLPFSIPSKWERAKSKIKLFPYQITASRSDEWCCMVENIKDGNLDSIWTAKGFAPATLTIRPQEPHTIKSVWLLARQPHDFIECWKKVLAELYLGEELVSKQEFVVSNAEKERIQSLRFEPKLIDRIDLTFSHPVLVTVTGMPVDPIIVNPGYHEILVDWEK